MLKLCDAGSLQVSHAVDVQPADAFVMFACVSRSKLPLSAVCTQQGQLLAPQDVFWQLGSRLYRHSPSKSPDDTATHPVYLQGAIV